MSLYTFDTIIHFSRSRHVIYVRSEYVKRYTDVSESFPDSPVYGLTFTVSRNPIPPEDGRQK